MERRISLCKVDYFPVPEPVSTGLTMLDPNVMQDMAAVRSEVDRIDAALIDLLAHRFACMDAAARIKDDRADVRDETRKAQVIVNARRLGRAKGVPEPLVADLWERLVEASIAYETDRWDEVRAD